jgi:AcrR family transcriptional regulator
MAKRSGKDAATTRQEILDVARRLFAEQGYAATAIAQIARDAGMTSGAIFHHFADKKALFREVVVTLQTEVHQAIYQAAVPAKTAIEGFRLGARESMRATQRQDYQRIVSTEAPSVLGREAWGDIDARMGYALIERRLKMIAGSTELPDHLVKPMAIMTLGMMNETTFALARGDPGIDIDQCLALLDRALLDWVERDIKPWQSRQNSKRRSST